MNSFSKRSKLVLHYTCKNHNDASCDQTAKCSKCYKIFCDSQTGLEISARNLRWYRTWLEIKGTQVWILVWFFVISPILLHLGPCQPLELTGYFCILQKSLRWSLREKLFKGRGRNVTVRPVQIPKPNSSVGRAPDYRDSGNSGLSPDLGCVQDRSCYGWLHSWTIS